MKPTLPNSEHELLGQSILEGAVTPEFDEKAAHETTITRLRLLWGQRQFLLRAVWFGLLSSIFIAFLIPKHYESTARLMPPDRTSGTAAMLSALAQRVGGGWDQGASQMPVALAALGAGVANPGAPLMVGVLKSDTVQDDLIHKFDLQKVYKTRYLEDTRQELAAHSGISEDVLSGIITITVTDRKPQRAAAMAGEYVEELNRVVSQLSTSAARRERIFLEGRLKSVKEELDRSAVEFSRFASKNTAIDIKEQGKAMVEAAAILQGQLIAAQTEQEGLRQIYTDNNVRLRSLSARIAELKHQLENMGGKDVNALENPTADTGELYPSIRKLPLLGVTYADLYRRTKIDETIYELLTQQYEMARVQEAKEIPTVKLLDSPLVPEKHSFPPRALLILLGTLLSLSFGTAWVLGTARWAEIDQNDPRKEFAREVLASLKPQAIWVSRNGSHLRAISEKVWNRLQRREVPDEIQQSPRSTAMHGRADWDIGAGHKAPDDSRR
jgi:capsule polysaccharide export protein KpsE/RkpR